MSISKLELKEIFRLLREKPSMMFTGDKDSLDTYVVYFQGFGLGYDVIKGTNFEQEISSWYHKKFQTKASNMIWSTHFSQKNKNKSEKEKISLFLKCVEEFVLENLSNGTD